MSLPSSATALTPPAETPTSAWRSFALRGATNLVLCLAIAVIMWAMSPQYTGGFLIGWLYSTAIGTACWFFIDGGRIALARALPWRPTAARQRQPRWPGPVWMMVCIVVGTALGYTLGSTVGDAITGHHTPSLLGNRAAMLISLIAAIGATFYFVANERLHDERAAAEAARRLAAESQLRLLESQIEPHMLFNTLANLRVLIGADAAKAQAMLDRLIAYLRATLAASRTGSHPLATEFDRLADYLALMAIRMGPRLAVRFDLPQALRDLPVPPLLLQPLVENAIRHGLEPRVEGGELRIAAQRSDGMLCLSVRDTGGGLPVLAPDGQGQGYGLAHVRERLAALYGDRAGFTLAAATDADGGTIAEVRLPLERAPTTLP